LWATHVAIPMLLGNAVMGNAIAKPMIETQGVALG
jgi:hypothetical protein